MPRLLLFRLLSNIELKNDCWVWKLDKSHNGYGRVKFNGKTQRAHRISYEVFKGKIPDGMVIDHICSNRACINPEHLEVVTHLENVRRTNLRGNNARSKKTHCPKGHEYKGYNVILNNNMRRCRICHNECVLKRYYKNV